MSDILTPEQVAEVRDARRECAKENRALREQIRRLTDALRKVRDTGKSDANSLVHRDIARRALLAEIERESDD